MRWINESVELQANPRELGGWFALAIALAPAKSITNAGTNYERGEAYVGSTKYLMYGTYVYIRRAAGSSRRDGGGGRVLVGRQRFLVSRALCDRRFGRSPMASVHMRGEVRPSQRSRRRGAGLGEIGNRPDSSQRLWQRPFVIARAGRAPGAKNNRGAPPPTIVIVLLGLLQGGARNLIVQAAENAEAWWRRVTWRPAEWPAGTRCRHAVPFYSSKSAQPTKAKEFASNLLTFYDPVRQSPGGAF